MSVVSNGTEPPAAVVGLGLDTTGGGPWLQRQKKNSSSVSVQTYLINSAAHPGPPPPTAAGARGNKTPVRLPALTAKGPRRKGSMARLSLSEPSLFTHNDSVLLGGLSNVHRPSLLQKRASATSSSSFKPSALTLSSSTQPLLQDSLQPQTRITRPIYIHFSQSIQPSLKPRATRRHSHNPGLNSDLQPFVPQGSPLSEPLSVVGKTCLPSCSPRPAQATVPGPSRPQLHVFLPTEAEGEDSESVDEGFMDELDSKMSSMKLQKGVPQTVPLYCSRKKLSSCTQ